MNVPKNALTTARTVANAEQLSPNLARHSTATRPYSKIVHGILPAIEQYPQPYPQLVHAVTTEPTVSARFDSSYWVQSSPTGTMSAGTLPPLALRPKSATKAKTGVSHGK